MTATYLDQFKKPKLTESREQRADRVLKQLHRYARLGIYGPSNGEIGARLSLRSSQVKDALEILEERKAIRFIDRHPATRRIEIMVVVS